MEIVSGPLKLTNDGQLWVYFLGCGSAFSRRHFQTNVLVVKGDDHLLIDCGTTCSQALRAAGLSTLDINDVLITHSHADHVGGLEELTLMNRYVGRRKARIHIPASYQSILWNRSLRGGAEMNERHDGVPLTFEDYWEVSRPVSIRNAPRDGQRFSVGSLSVRTFRTRHYPEQAESWKDAMYSVGVVLDERVVISGDTQFDADMLEAIEPADGAEHIFHDAQLFPGGIHESLQELSGLPVRLRERMSLVHYGDNFEDHMDTVVANKFAGFARQGVIYAFP